MINLVVLEGRLVKDVEVRYTENEVAVGNFTIAVPRSYKNQDGEYETDFLDCTIFKEKAESIQKYAHKGDLISVRGNLRKRSYEDKEGKKHYITEVFAEKVSYLSTKDLSEPTTPDMDAREKTDENPFADMRVKVEADQSIVISDDELPF